MKAGSSVHATSSSTRRSMCLTWRQEELWKLIFCKHGVIAATIMPDQCPGMHDDYCKRLSQGIRHKGLVQLIMT